MKEEQPRLLVQHVAVDRGHVDAVRPQRHYDGIYFVARKHEITSDSRLAAARRLEVNRYGHAHWSNRRNLHSAFHDRIAPRHVELIDPADRLSSGADALIELDCVQINGWWWSSRSRGRQRGIACAERVTNNGRHLGRITITACD